MKLWSKCSQDGTVCAPTCIQECYVLQQITIDLSKEEEERSAPVYSCVILIGGKLEAFGRCLAIVPGFSR